MSARSSSIKNGSSPVDCKAEMLAAQAPDDELAGNGHVESKYMGTVADRREMNALGKSQVLRRNFRFISILGFGSTLIATWEVILTLLGFGLLNGGTAGLVWGFLVIFFGATMVFASLAEMASMAPTAGGQYHWVSEFAPRSWQKYLSYITGWICTLGWQCTIVAISFIAGTVIQGLITLNNDAYVPKQWHGTLLVIGIAIFAVFFNTLLAKKLPMVEGLFLILHALGIFLIIIPLWVLAPRHSAKFVFTEFNNGGGWNSIGTSALIGFTTSLPSMIGYDCTVHMAEEIQDASRTLPKAIMGTVFINGILGFLMMLTLCFTLGDVNSILETKTGFPFIQVFYNTTQNLKASSAMCAIVVLTLTASAISEIATASRQLWSFSRDNGMPFSSILSHVPPRWNIPLNAVFVSLFATSLLSLINLGSSIALNAIISLTNSSLVTSYMISIGCVLLKRLRGEPLPSRRWSLGRFGLAINIAALCYLAPMFVFAFFPPQPNPNAQTMNWAIVMYGFVISFATIYYIFVGRFHYVPPVSLVKREE
ncbi:hypothetical protein LOZ51_006761 [Ophidiomyces ophidiicola]|nr:hypothetical protein LOZ55_006149 [Ophidiomyces ophidiicola]KAI1984076.1 hypothetical protein LOZ51_006761 [Ophidiomyces ophidiicola]KAI1985365.1 hypothetical protein LOZ54_004235 [Ophidiomyces ophidiicola]